jgi:hypothetical protein
MVFPGLSGFLIPFLKIGEISGIILPLPLKIKNRNRAIF